MKNTGDYNFKKLGSASGTLVYETGKRLFLFKKPAQWTTVALFVTVLLFLIFLVNGILQLYFSMSSETGISMIGIILSCLGLLFGFISWLLISYRKKVNTIPADKLYCICIFDFEKNLVLNSDESVLTPITSAGLSHKFQMTSSSPSLVLKWGKNSLLLVKGNPFSGGITEVENILVAKGVSGL